MVDPTYGIHLMLKIGGIVLIVALIVLCAIVFGPVIHGYIAWYNKRNPDRKFFSTPNFPFDLLFQKIEPDMDEKLKKGLRIYQTIFGGFWLLVILVLVFCALRQLLQFF